MPRPAPRIRIRLLQGTATAFGPGKADLLEALAECGSLRAAAKHMGLSYLKAWRLLQVMNDCFREPLVALSRGGAGGGGASLTETGREVLALYRAMEPAALAAIAPLWRKLQRRLAPPKAPVDAMPKRRAAR
ncbi:MAG: LysR family transcriptional regulator [Verrucomicrobia bacterium]|nr:LysR family transcriptional regulator [Verrucomicrobiota bacterium]